MPYDQLSGLTNFESHYNFGNQAEEDTNRP